jgi:uncharacterized membrane protein
VTHPFLLAAMLAGIVAGLLFLNSQPRTRFLFKYLPVAFWCYFVPILGASAGVLPPQSSLYVFVSKSLLPFCLVLLLISVDLKNIRRLSRPAAIALAASFGSIVVAAPLVYAVLAARLPEGAWQCVGMLSASWTGGSANMLAVKEALGTPEALFAPTLVVDAVLSYSWMAFLILLSGQQKRIDLWLGAKPVALPVFEGSATREGRWPLRAGGLLLCAAVAAAAYFLGRHTPLQNIIFNGATWAVLLATTFALMISLTGFCRRESAFFESLGRASLYFLLTCLGAQASLSSVAAAPLLFVLGIIWLIIHGLCMAAAGKIFKIPASLLATASQAGIGGPASAPLVAEVYSPGLAAAAVLMAVFGSAVGTYLGLLCAKASGVIGRVISSS